MKAATQSCSGKKCSQNLGKILKKKKNTRKEAHSLAKPNIPRP